MVETKEYYINKAKKKWDEVLADEILELKKQGYVPSADEKNLWVHPITGYKLCPSDCASTIYDEVLNAEEVVGYYLWLHKENALKDWKTNTSGIKMSEQDKKVDKILEKLCA